MLLLPSILFLLTASPVFFSFSILYASTATDLGSREIIPVTADESPVRPCLPLDQRQNLVANSGFEKGDKAPVAWRIIVPEQNRQRSWYVNWTDSPSLAHTGSRAVELAVTVNGVNSESSWLDRVIIESAKIRLAETNQPYALSAWIKTVGVESGHVIIKVKYFDNEGAPLTTIGHVMDIFYAGNGSASEWQRVVFLVTPPYYKKSEDRDASIAGKAAISISLDNTPGRCWIDDISFTKISSDQYATHHPSLNYLPPPLRQLPAAPRKMEKKETFYLHQEEGVWWLVGPTGRPQWSIGVNFSTNDFLLAVTGLKKRDYLRQSQYRAGFDLKFNQGWREKISQTRYSAPLANIVWLNFASEADIAAEPEEWVAKDRNGRLIAGWGHYFPDVFSPIWQKHAATEAETLLSDDAWVIKSPQTIGYWTDNEFAYGDLYDFIWGDASPLAFIDWLQGKNDLPSIDHLFAKAGSQIDLDVPPGFECEIPYRDIAQLNSAWSSKNHIYNYSSFKEISAGDKPYLRAHDDPIKKDFFAFERLIYKIYIDTVINNIKRVEMVSANQTSRPRSHLIFSNRFSIESPAALTALRKNMDLFARFDVVAVNLYPGYNHLKTYYPLDLLKMIKQTFHDTTGRPLYISEFGVAAEDASGCDQTPCLNVRRWRPNTVSQQEYRGLAYRNIVSTLANLPFVIGANWFQWSNGYGSPSGTDPRNSGLVDDHDNYYTPLTSAVRSVNQQLPKLQRSSHFSLADIDWSQTEIETCE